MSAKGGPAFYAAEPTSFLFSILSGILLHKYSKKGSKVQDTIINYFVCDALNSTGVKAVKCVLKTTMSKMNKICHPNVLKVR